MTVLLLRLVGINQKMTCCGCMSHNVSSNWLFWVSIKHSCSIHLRNHLIGQHNGNPEFVCQLQQRPEELGEMHLNKNKISILRNLESDCHLSGGELPPSAVVSPVAGGGAVHDDEGVPGLGHHGGRLGQQRHLVVGVVGPGVGHVVEDVASLEAVPVRHRQEPLWPEGPLGVYVEALALRPPVVDGQLTGDGQGVAQLRLASPKGTIRSDNLC